MNYAKEQESIIYIQDKRAGDRKWFWKYPANWNFKAAIIHIFKEVKKTKDLEESITMTHQIETIKRREIKKTEHKFWNWKV